MVCITVIVFLFLRQRHKLLLQELAPASQNQSARALTADNASIVELELSHQEFLRTVGNADQIASNRATHQEENDAI